jgi:hypothetical protein
LAESLTESWPEEEEEDDIMIAPRAMVDVFDCFLW